ncbi:MAG: hypothetical protein NTZ60_08105 [Campylobacterales bacterium]|nr:hypothetical protein [Campylobacterales bacterium]
MFPYDIGFPSLSKKSNASYQKKNIVEFLFHKSSKIIFILFMLLGAENLFAITKSIVKTDTDSDEVSTKSIEGEILIGNFFSNSSYTATPANEGLVENRYAVSLTYHPSEHWFGSIDMNSFTDKTKKDRYTQLSEFDRVLRVGYTDNEWECYIEDEKDATLDNSFYQAYTALAVKRKGSVNIGEQSLSASLTAEKLIQNETYYARPDNTGLANMRYILHWDYDFGNKWVLSNDNNFFTDQNKKTALDKFTELSEFDCLIQISYKINNRMKISLARETDMSLDQVTPSQTYWGTFLSMGF